MMGEVKMRRRIGNIFADVRKCLLVMQRIERREGRDVYPKSLEVRQVEDR